VCDLAAVAAVVHHQELEVSLRRESTLSPPI
jgi:hypothetical protein